MNTQAGSSDNRTRAQFESTPLLQSRELGEVGAPQPHNVASIGTKPTPVAKSWAHFVAGGYAFALLKFHSFNGSIAEL
jgi:solute carrier family 25 protein 33/36